MVTSWRIISAEYKNDAFSGEGARINGGRWNSKGVSVVYTAGSLSLALIEMLVNLPAPKLLQKFVRIPLSFDTSLIHSITEDQLPSDWNSRPASPSTKAVGDAWVKDEISPVLKVPSVVVPEESNYIINPNHPEYNKISIGEPIVYFFDPRLSKR